MIVITKSLSGLYVFIALNFSFIVVQYNLYPRLCLWYKWHWQTVNEKLWAIMDVKFQNCVIVKKALGKNNLLFAVTLNLSTTACAWSEQSIYINITNH